jgi:DeoR/GlpR family transcriptional regulator of sugar metabolism
MQIFLSHSSRQKPLVREIRKNLPEHLSTWIDEQKLLFGDSLTQSIETTIRSETDYVLLFLDDHAASSDWVKKEIKWTLQAEKALNRTILLPIIIDEVAVAKMDDLQFKDRKYLILKDYVESSVRTLSENITSELFARVCRDIYRLRNPSLKTPFSTIADAETMLRKQATLIEKAVFPHRKSNPISKDKLLEVVRAIGNTDMQQEQFDAILGAIVQRNLIPGLLYDGFEAFLQEEHARWKAEVEHAKKERIGKKAAGYVQSGMKVFLDAGSTTEEIVRVICTKIENRAINKITIATTSVNIADMFSDCCVKMGFDDEFSAMRLFIPGGQIRPSTQAIVPAFGTGPRHIIALADALGGFDIGILGVNGVDVDAGFSTHQNSEALNKADIIGTSSRRIIVGDSSKVGLVLDCKFANFSDDLQLVTDNDPDNERLKALLARYSEKIILA